VREVRFFPLAVCPRIRVLSLYRSDNRASTPEPFPLPATAPPSVSPCLPARWVLAPAAAPKPPPAAPLSARAGAPVRPRFPDVPLRCAPPLSQRKVTISVEGGIAGMDDVDKGGAVEKN
jgi:hypothetical protein